MMKSFCLGIAVTAMIFALGYGNAASAQPSEVLSLDEATTVIKQLMELRQRAEKLQT